MQHSTLALSAIDLKLVADYPLELALLSISDPKITGLSVQDLTTGVTNPAVLNPGDSVAYSYSVANAGPGTAQVSLVDQAPANLVGTSWSVVDSAGTQTGTGAIAPTTLDIGAGSAASIVVRGTIDPNATSGNISHLVTATPVLPGLSSNPQDGTLGLAIGSGGSSLVLVNADLQTSAAQTGTPIAVMANAAVLDSMDTTGGNIISADVHLGNTALGSLAIGLGTLAPLSSSYNAATGDLTFEGTLAQVSAELDGLTFVPSAPTMAGTPTANLTTTLLDLTTGQQAVDTRASIGIDIPSLLGSVGGALLDTAGTILGGIAPTKPFATVSVTDPGAGAITATVSVNSANGDLSAASTLGWTRTSTVPGSEVYSHTFVGTGTGPGSTTAAGAAQAGIDALVYVPNPLGGILSGTTASFGVGISDDLGNTLAPITGTDTMAGGNGAGPIILSSGASTISSADNAPVKPFGSLLVTDTGTAPVVATIAVNAATGDLTAASTQGWTRTPTAGGASYTQTFAASTGVGAAVTTAVDALVFQPVPGSVPQGTTQVDTVSLSLSDGLGDTAGSTATLDVGSSTTTTTTPGTGAGGGTGGTGTGTGGTGGTSTTMTTTTNGSGITTPTISGVAANTTTADAVALKPLATVGISEPDNVASTLVVRIEDGTDKGDFAPSSTAGFVRTLDGADIVYSATLPQQANAGAALTALADGLVYKSDAVAPGTSRATVLDLVASFGMAGQASTLSTRTTITAQGSINPYAMLSAEDSRPTGVVTLSASLPQGTQGSYANLGMGTVEPANPLTYTVTGTAQQVTDAIHSVVFVPAQGSTAMPASYNAMFVGDSTGATLVDAASGSNTLTSEGTDDTVFSGAGNDTLFSSATGTSVLVGGSGHDVFINSGGMASIFSGGGGSTFFAGTGTTVVSESTGQDTFVGGAGASSVYGGTASSTNYGGTGSFSFLGGQGEAVVVESTGVNTVFGGTGPVSVYGSTGGSGILVGGSNGANVIISGTGNTTMVGAGTTDSLVATGAGNDLLVAGPGQDTLSATASTGDNIFVGAGGQATMAAGNATSLVVGGTGMDTIYAGSAGNLVYFGGTGTDQLVGGGSSDTYALGSGNETIFGSTGADNYVLNAGHAGGNITVEDFKVGTDYLDLFGYKSSEVSNALANATVGGGSTSLGFSDGTHMLFVGTTNLSGSILHGADA